MGSALSVITFIVLVFNVDAKWRNPDLVEVIDYLSHENDAVKANAAAYLQHLTYLDDNIKAQTRYKLSSAASCLITSKLTSGKFCIVAASEQTPRVWYAIAPVLEWK